MEEVEQRLLDYITASAHAQPILSQLHGLEIRAIDIQNALCSVLGIDGANPSGLLDHKITNESIIQHLRDFDFRQYHPEVLTQFELEDGIIPQEMRRLLSEQTIKVKGEIWRVHKSDVDPWPSNPHAHNYEAAVTLHLGTGELFDNNRRSIGKIKKEKLEIIRAKLVKFELPEMTR